MSKSCRTLFVALIAFVLALPGANAVADEAADIEAVERELEAEAMALELYDRARSRAVKAVEASSLAQEHKALTDSTSDAFDSYLRASDEADLASDRASKAWEIARKAEFDASLEINPTPRAGEDVIDARIRAMQEWRAADKTRPHALSLSEESRTLREFASTLFQKYMTASDKALAQSERMRMVIDKMTLKFLVDEITKAVEQGLGDLERELREIHEKAQKELTI